jgi:hypothetical protein
MAAEESRKLHFPRWVTIYFLVIAVGAFVVLILARINGGRPW